MNNRQIEVVHHWSVIGGETWLIVFRIGKRKQTVATFETKRDAIERLGFFSQKLHAKIVGRGLELQHDRVQP
jgi:hypothetical protein